MKIRQIKAADRGQIACIRLRFIRQDGNTEAFVFGRNHSTRQIIKIWSGPVCGVYDADNCEYAKNQKSADLYCLIFHCLYPINVRVFLFETQIPALVFLRSLFDSLCR